MYQLGEMHCCPTTVVSPHCQQCYELTYVLSGKGKTVTNGTETVLSPGDCSVNFPGDTHSIVSDRENPLRYAFCGFMPDPGDRVWSMIIAELHRLFDGKNERIFRMKDENNVFYDIFTEINSDDFMSGEFISASLEKFLILLIRTGRKEPETFYSSNIKSETMLTYQIQQYLMHHVCEIRKLTELESLFQLQLPVYHKVLPQNRRRDPRRLSHKVPHERCLQAAYRGTDGHSDKQDTQLFLHPRFHPQLQELFRNDSERVPQKPQNRVGKCRGGSRKDKR